MPIRIPMEPRPEDEREILKTFLEPIQRLCQINLDGYLDFLLQSAQGPEGSLFRFDDYIVQKAKKIDFSNLSRIESFLTLGFFPEKAKKLDEHMSRTDWNESEVNIAILEFQYAVEKANPPTNPTVLRNMRILELVPGKAITLERLAEDGSAQNTNVELKVFYPSEVPKSDGLFNYYYHGTKKSNLLSIVSCGAIPHFSNFHYDFNTAFYLHQDLELAWSWASKIARADDPGVVLIFKIPKSISESWRILRLENEPALWEDLVIKFCRRRFSEISYFWFFSFNAVTGPFVRNAYNVERNNEVPISEAFQMGIIDVKTSLQISKNIYGIMYV